MSDGEPVKAPHGTLPMPRRGETGEWYAGEDWRAGQLENRLLGELFRRFPLAKSLLEVGCGTGHLTRWFADQQLHAVELDISDVMLAETRRRSGEYVGGDANALPYSADLRDLVALIAHWNSFLIRGDKI